MPNGGYAGARGGLRTGSVHRVGQVTARDPATCRVRVTFAEADALVSGWLPVLQPKTLRDRAYWLPDLGEHVACLLDVDAEDGVVLGALYSAADPVPPIDGRAPDGEAWHVGMADGTTLTYDRVAHRLAIAIPGPGAALTIQVNGPVTVDAAADVTLTVAETARVFLGGRARALRLATERFVRDVFLTHKHPTFGGLTGVPVPTGTELGVPALTEKARAE